MVARTASLLVAEKIIPSLIFRRQNILKSFEKSNFLVGQAKDPLTGKSIGYEGFIGKKDWNKYLSDFSFVYKNAASEGRESLRKGVGGKFWQTALRQAREKGLLKTEDVKKAHGLSSVYSMEKITKLQSKNFENKREAIQSVWNDILGKAKKNKDGFPILKSARILQPAAILPKLKKKFPALFPEHASAHGIQDLILHSRTGRKRLEYPKFEQSPTIDPSTIISQFHEGYTGTKVLPAIDRRYFQELFRSRNVADPKLNTGNIEQDTINFAKFLDRQQVLDPASDYYYRKNPEFVWYYVTKKQPAGAVREFRKGKHLAHTTPSVMPTGGRHFERYEQTNIPWTGGEIGGTHFLEKSAHVGSKTKNITGQTTLEIDALNALKARDWDKFIKIDRKMLSKNIRTTITDPITGESYPMGGWEEFGYDQGGLVNGYAKGGLLKKGLEGLLGSSLMNMSRRKFLKGAGASMAFAAMPKAALKLGALKLAAPAVKKAGLSYAPPWVSSMVAVLKSVPLEQSLMRSFSVGNNANIMKLGSKKIKVYKDQTATESYFRIKTSDQVKTEEMVPGIKNQDQFWDDIVLREEKGQTTITWKNKDFDAGNDQHIVIDKINKETKFIDDNWHMEAGGEDIAKDDWIEYAITPNKNEIAVALKKPIKTIDDWTVDGYSVRDMDNQYSGMFESFVDSFSPSGNVFGTVQRMSQALKKKAILKREKMYNDKQVGNLKEQEMMDWEEQFRGGKGIHGYGAGGIHGGRPKPHDPSFNLEKRINFLRSKNDAQLMASMMMAEQDKNPGDARKIAHVINNRAVLGKSRGTFSELRERDGYKNLSAIARVLGGHNRQFTPFSSTKNLNFFKNFQGNKTYKDYLSYAEKVVAGTEFDPTGGATFFDKDPRRYLEMEDYTPAWDVNNPNTMINRTFDDEGAPAEGHYFWKYNMNEGGLVPPKSGPDPLGYSIQDASNYIRQNPQNFVGGGLVTKLLAPKVLGNLTQYATRGYTGKIKALPKAKLYKPPKGPYSITDESGARVLNKNFGTLAEAQKALDELAALRTQDASTFKIFGKRKPKTAEGVWEGAPEVNLSMVGKKIGTEGTKSPAMFWGSREKIINSPLESMTGKQWLNYLQLPKHGILNPKGMPVIKHAELNDTSLAPFLSKYASKVIPKRTLVRVFDKIAPELEVEVAGREIAPEMMRKLRKSLDKIDPESLRGKEGEFFALLKSRHSQLERGLTSDTNKIYREEAQSIMNDIDKFVFDNYGVRNAIAEGVPQRFPYRMKQALAKLSSASGQRTAGYAKYPGEPFYAGQQTLSGGENPRELLFRYKPGAMRSGEPVYDYAHSSFNMPDKSFKNAFVHMRMTDRTDEFGRRILFIEEIQSDMHQPINAAMRAAKRSLAEGQTVARGTLKSSKYAPRGDVPVPVSESDAVNKAQFKLVKSKIEELGAKRQTAAIQKQIVKLNKEREKIRKIIEESEGKALPETSGVPQGTFSKTEDYNEFVMKYATKMAQEGGYDGVAIATAEIKNIGLRPTDGSFQGNLVAYGPMAQGALRKVAKKSGAKIITTAIIDGKGVGWRIPMLLLKENEAAIANIARGMPAYKRGGIARNG